MIYYIIIVRVHFGTLLIKIPSENLCNQEYFKKNFLIYFKDKH